MPPPWKAPLGERATARDAAGLRRKVSRVETPPIKVIGRLKQAPWPRFARLQRTTAKLTAGKGQPKGVFRFASHEECEPWTAEQCLRTHVVPALKPSPPARP
jgi:hypothetical protein